MAVLEHGAVRKARNFKGLQLARSSLSIPIPRLTTTGDPPDPAPSGALEVDQSSFLEPASGDEASPALAPGANAQVPQRRSQPKPAPLAVLDSPLDPRPPPGAPATAPAAPDEPQPDPPPAPPTAGSGMAFPKKPPGRLRKRAPTTLKLDLAPSRSAGDVSADASTAGTGEGSAVNYHSKLSEQLASLELTGARRHKGGESELATPIELSDADLEFLSELGAGNGGTVTKVRHGPSNKVMAKKAVFIDAKPSVRKQILRELQIMHECDSPYIIGFFGAYLNEPRICMCMEYMDRGSLDQIYKRTGAIPPAICARVASVVVNGLLYLYDVHRIIHRDVKPSNILANSQGELKLCDFGVSGELINSIADTFVGTSTYMSPERIQGDQYSVKSDVWSLGVTLIELALGRFPFSDDEEGSSPRVEPMQLSILDLLQHIVNEPSPRLPSSADPNLRSFTDACLLKDPIARASPKDLLAHPLIAQATCTNAEIASWIASFDS